MLAGNAGTSNTYFVPGVVETVLDRSKWTHENPDPGVIDFEPRMVPGAAAVPVRTLTVMLDETRTCKHRSMPFTPARDGTNSWRRELVVSCPPGKCVWSHA